MTSQFQWLSFSVKARGRRALSSLTMERFFQVWAVAAGKPRQSNLWLSGGRHGRIIWITQLHHFACKIQFSWKFCWAPDKWTQWLPFNGSKKCKLPNRQGSGRGAGGGHKTGYTPASLATSSIHSSLLPSKLKISALKVDDMKTPGLAWTATCSHALCMKLPKTHRRRVTYILKKSIFNINRHYHTHAGTFFKTRGPNQLFLRWHLSYDAKRQPSDNYTLSPRAHTSHTAPRCWQSGPSHSAWPALLPRSTPWPCLVSVHSWWLKLPLTLVWMWEGREDIQERSLRKPPL